MTTSRLLLALACLPLLGCPEDPPEEEGVCPAMDAVPGLTMTPNRGDEIALVEGGQVPVFYASQGGIFTELDVELTGVADDDVEQIRVEFIDTTGRPLATQVYFGSGLPLRCNESGTLTIQALPVGFDESIGLEELDGSAARLTAEVTTPDDTFGLDLALMLVAVDG